jgi:hypothetical protein
MSAETLQTEATVFIAVSALRPLYCGQCIAVSVLQSVYILRPVYLILVHILFHIQEQLQ